MMIVFIDKENNINNKQFSARPWAKKLYVL